MFLPEQLPGLRRQIRAQAGRDYGILGDLVAQARAMAPGVRPSGRARPPRWRHAAAGAVSDERAAVRN
jgi:hypothetical protein